MTHDLLLAIYFLLPAAIANATPIFVAAIPALQRFDTPLDFGKTFRGKPIFGPHKTFRGLVSGIVVATLVFELQRQAAVHYGWTDTIKYDHISFWLGPLFGLGALGGDAIESFCKRQIGIPSGERWIPYDQLDYICGAILVSLLFVRLPAQLYLYMIVFWFGAHLLASYIGYLLKLKQDPI